MKPKVEQLVPYLSFRNNVLTIPGYRFVEVRISLLLLRCDAMRCDERLTILDYSYIIILGTPLTSLSPPNP